MASSTAAVGADHDTLPQSALLLLFKYATNADSHQGDPKYRRIRLANKKFAAQVGFLLCIAVTVDRVVCRSLFCPRMLAAAHCHDSICRADESA